MAKVRRKPCEIARSKDSLSISKEKGNK
jgi:hypothetical protein